MLALRVCIVLGPSQGENGHAKSCCLGTRDAESACGASQGKGRLILSGACRLFGHGFPFPLRSERCLTLDELPSVCTRTLPRS